MNGMNLSKPRVAWGFQGWLGLLLLAMCWPLNWTLPGMRTAYLFFPLWLGYILVMDALVQGRTGASLWTRPRRDFVLLFVASTPAWWLFELIPLRVGTVCPSLAPLRRAEILRWYAELTAAQRGNRDRIPLVGGNLAAKFADCVGSAIRAAAVVPCWSQWRRAKRQLAGIGAVCSGFDSTRTSQRRPKPEQRLKAPAPVGQKFGLGNRHRDAYSGFIVGGVRTTAPD